MAKVEAVQMLKELTEGLQLVGLDVYGELKSGASSLKVYDDSGFLAEVEFHEDMMKMRVRKGYGTSGFEALVANHPEHARKTRDSNRGKYPVRVQTEGYVVVGGPEQLYRNFVGILALPRVSEPRAIENMLTNAYEADAAETAMGLTAIALDTGRHIEVTAGPFHIPVLAHIGRTSLEIIDRRAYLTNGSKIVLANIPYPAKIDFEELERNGVEKDALKVPRVDDRIVKIRLKKKR